MKKKLLIICLVGLMFSACSDRKNSIQSKKQEQSYFLIKKEYHIAVKNWKDKYQIVFTNNDWLTEQNIQTAFDISYWDNEVTVVRQLHLGSKEECLKIAKQLRTYQDCLYYNDKIKAKERELIKFRKANPKKGNGTYDEYLNPKKNKEEELIIY